MASLVAFQQLRELIETQEVQLDRLRRQKEEEEHTKTKSNLAAESEQLEFALGEIDVLSKQLEREKQAFDSTLSRVNSKVLKQSIQKDKLISKCTEIETHIQKQEDVLNHKENEIKELQHYINKQKQTLKKQASDFKIQKQQECYIANVLGKKNKDFK
ncbi:spermatogenesis-associated protein 24 isoform X2 [Hemicordylus capensis]|uniref:spermatogenesis-associated protein 24 isoform X2 n=1 Tax=Hemicordylus capensis TaxID=884348 RepID=UPI0023028E30|nr:spermatogenesis-associated protein 24 isoform X2 [Hemicordylus capensis]